MGTTMYALLTRKRRSVGLVRVRGGASGAEGDGRLDCSLSLTTATLKTHTVPCNTHSDHPEQKFKIPPSFHWAHGCAQQV